jgi:serine/threonine protein kinase
MVKKDPHNSKIDIWSIGLLAYELIVGRVPFKIWSEFDLPVILKQ